MDISENTAALTVMIILNKHSAHFYILLKFFLCGIGNKTNYIQ